MLLLSKMGQIWWSITYKVQHKLTYIFSIFINSFPFISTYTGIAIYMVENLFTMWSHLSFFFFSKSETIPAIPWNIIITINRMKYIYGIFVIVLLHFRGCLSRLRKLFYLKYKLPITNFIVFRNFLVLLEDTCILLFLNILPSLIKESVAMSKIQLFPVCNYRFLMFH